MYMNTSRCMHRSDILGGNLLILHMQQRMKQDAAERYLGTCCLPPALPLDPEIQIDLE